MRATTLIVVQVAVLAACSHVPVDSKPIKEHAMKTDKQDIIEAVSAMTKAFHAGDIERVMASYEPAATIAFDPTAPTTDRAEQRVRFEAFFALKPEFTYAGHDVVIQGDVATHVAPWTMRATTPDGQSIEDQGLSVAVLRRQADGRWLMIIDMPKGAHLMATRN